MRRIAALLLALLPAVCWADTLLITKDGYYLVGDNGVPVKLNIDRVIDLGKPIPPGPNPPPEPPTPPEPPKPQPAGPRQVVIFRESSSDTPALGRLFTGLQAGTQSQYLKSKGHSCFVLQDDDKDAEGNTPKLILDWRPHYAGMTLPVLVILDKASGKVVHKESIKATATADSVIETLKAHGG